MAKVTPALLCALIIVVVMAGCTDQSEAPAYDLYADIRYEEIPLLQALEAEEPEELAPSVPIPEERIEVEREPEPTELTFSERWELWWEWMEQEHQMPPDRFENEYYVGAGLNAGENRHLLLDWVALFEMGEPAPPLRILVSTHDGGHFIRLDYDGGPYYTATVFTTRGELIREYETFTSAYIIRRAFDYVIPISIVGEWFISIPLEVERVEVDYDLETMPSLGEISPGEALEVLRYRLRQSYSAGHRRREFTYWFASGAYSNWFDWQSEEPVGSDNLEYHLERKEIRGATLLNGMLFYRITETGGGLEYFVSADGSIAINLFRHYHILADANEVWITPPTGN